MTGEAGGRQAGDRLGRYRIVRRLGSGAMGEVYLAEDPQIERRLAVKTVRLHGPDDQVAERKQRLLREAKAAGRLLHPHVVTLFDAGEDEGTVFLAFEYVEGPDLGERLRAGGSVPVEEALRLVRQCAGALEAAHSRSVVHRDIKPANILLTPEGDAKVADFGIAKVVGQQTELTTTGTVIGSPQYMSPEQVRGETLDGRTDLFSLGTVLYELLSGSRAFSGDTITTLVYQILNQEPVDLAQLRPDLPPALVRLVRRMMAKDRETRTASAAEVVAEIERIERALAGAVDQPTRLLDSEAAKSPPPPPPARPAAVPSPPEPEAAPAAPAEQRAAAARSARPSLWLILVPVLLVAVAGLGWWLWPEDPEPAAPLSGLEVAAEDGEEVAVRSEGAAAEAASSRSTRSTATEEPPRQPSESAAASPSASTETRAASAPSQPSARQPEPTDPESTTARREGAPDPGPTRESAAVSSPRQAAATGAEETAAQPKDTADRVTVEAEAPEVRSESRPSPPPMEGRPAPDRERPVDVGRPPPPEERFPIQLRLETGLELAFEVDPKDAFVQFRGRGDSRFTQAGRAEEYSGSRRAGALRLPGPGEYLIRLRAQDRADYVIAVQARPGRPRQTLEIELGATGRGPRPLSDLPRRRAREGVVIEGPAGADVVVDGVVRGSIRELSEGVRLPPGLHRIVVEFRGRRGEVAVEITPEAEEAMVTLSPGRP